MVTRVGLRQISFALLNSQTPNKAPAWYKHRGRRPISPTNRVITTFLFQFSLIFVTVVTEFIVWDKFRLQSYIRRPRKPRLVKNQDASHTHTRWAGQGRARREAARRRKYEWKVKLDIRNSSRSIASKQLQKLYPRTTWRMDLRQLTVYEHFGCVNMRAITLLFVDQSSSRDSRLL